MQAFSAPRPDRRLLRLLEALDLAPELIRAPIGPPEGARWTVHLPVLAWLVRTQQPAILVDASGDPAGLATARQVIAENGLATRAVACGDDMPDSFAPGSVDLLRLGAPTLARFVAWRSRLSERAVVLCHGLRDDDGGLLAAWRELAATHPSFAFWYDDGVGILASGGALSPTLRALFALDEADGAALEKMFAARGEALRGAADRAALSAELALQELTSRQRIDERDAEIHRLQDEVRLYRESTSWRITAPLRLATTFLGQLRRPHLRRSDSRAAAATNENAKAELRAGLAVRLQQFLAGDARLQLPDSERPDVSILVVLHNQAELTFGCLTSIVACLGGSDIRVEIIIMDNASTDATAQLLSRLDGATIVRSGENLHFLRGVNRAAREARGRHLLLLNNDAQLRSGSLEAALAALETDNTIGAVGGRIVLPDGTLQEAGSIVWQDGTCSGYARGRDADDAEVLFRRNVDFCSGAFLLTPRKVFERLGGFDERYVPAYYEETDYCVRLWQDGLRVIYEPDAVVLHYEFGSAGATALEQQRHNLSTFRSRHREWLARQLPSAPEATLAARQVRTGPPRVLMIEDRVPHPHLGAGYPRANDLLRAISAHARVTLFPMERVNETLAGIRGSVPAEVEVLSDRHFPDLRGFLQQRRGFYDAIVVCRPHNMKRFVGIGGADPALRGTARLIYDAEAIFSARETLRYEAAGTPLSPAASASLLADEMVFSRRADVVLAVSAAEADVFREHGVGMVHVLGHALRAEPTEGSFEDRNTLLFVGAVHADWTPNADGLRWFAEKVLPPLRHALGTPIRLTVVGENHVAAIAQLGGAAFDLVGAVSDLRPHYATARLVVAPTRFAAGLPHKVAQAAAHGVPVVATDLLARQLGWTSGRDLLAAPDAAGFAKACARLYRDKDLWQSVRASALERVRQECAPERFEAAVARLMEKIPVRR